MAEALEGDDPRAVEPGEVETPVGLALVVDLRADGSAVETRDAVLPEDQAVGAGRGVVDDDPGVAVRRSRGQPSDATDPLLDDPTGGASRLSSGRDRCGWARGERSWWTSCPYPGLALQDVRELHHGPREGGEVRALDRVGRGRRPERAAAPAHPQGGVDAGEARAEVLEGVGRRRDREVQNPKLPRRTSPRPWRLPLPSSGESGTERCRP